MAAAADRLCGDLLEAVSPELVLVDPDLRSQVRDGRSVPDEILVGHRRTRDSDAAPEAAGDAVAADEHVPARAPIPLDAVRPKLLVVLDDPVPDVDEPEPDAPSHASVDELEGDRGIEDLIVCPAEDPATTESTNLTFPALPALPTGVPPVVPSDAVPHVDQPEPDALSMPQGSSDLPEDEVGIDDLIVRPTDERVAAENASRTYPTLPSLPTPALRHPCQEDATDVALRQIREQLETSGSTRPRRRSRRLLSVVSSVAALCSVALLAVDLHLGVVELPHWLPL